MPKPITRAERLRKLADAEPDYGESLDSTQGAKKHNLRMAAKDEEGGRGMFDGLDSAADDERAPSYSRTKAKGNPMRHIGSMCYTNSHK